MKKEEKEEKKKKKKLQIKQDYKLEKRIEKIKNKTVVSALALPRHHNEQVAMDGRKKAGRKMVR